MALGLQELNAVESGEFIAKAGFLVENSAWVLEKTATQRPFFSSDALCDAIDSEIRASSQREQLRLFNAHPELAGAEALAGTMTAASTGEQGRLGLNALDKTDLERLRLLNREYRSRFGYPFIIALRCQPTLTAVFAEFQRRLDNTPEQEISETIDQIMHVVRGRAARIANDATPVAPTNVGI